MSSFFVHPLASVIASLSFLLAATRAGAQLYSDDHLSLAGSLSAREMYDSNVLLQSQGPLANRGAAVSVVSPAVGLTLKNPLGLDATARLDFSTTSYFFHSQPQESHTDYAVGFKLAGKSDRWSHEESFSLLDIDGAHTSFRFTSPDGAPAIGAPALRDHRDQLQLRAGEKLQYTADQWFARGLLNYYSVDYHMAQAALPGYCNFTNRSDMNAGLDVGILTLPRLWAVAGYRYGYQDQGTVLTSSTQASNTYQRVLLGAEGNPLSWLKFSFLVGPDFRTFNKHAPAMREDTELYVEGSATATLSPDDELSVVLKRWTIPASGGKTVYNDSGYEVAWKHALTRELTARASFRVCGGEWDSAHRDDWIYIAKAGLEYRFDKHQSVEGGYQFEMGRSADSSLDGRDYDRHLVWIGWKYDL